MGGDAWAESEVGVGSQFFFTANLRPIDHDTQLVDVAVTDHSGAATAGVTPSAMTSVDPRRVALDDVAPVFSPTTPTAPYNSSGWPDIGAGTTGSDVMTGM